MDAAGRCSLLLARVGTTALLWVSLALVGCGQPNPSQPSVAEKPAAATPDPGRASESTARGTEKAQREGKLTLTEVVRAALAGDEDLRFLAIDVKAAGSAVDLFGTVDSAMLRTRAERIVAAVPGVKSVQNHLVLVSGS